MKSIFWIVLSVMLVSCASKQENQKNIEAKVANENVTSGAELNTSLHKIISESNTLSEKQKKDLTKIVEDTRTQNQQLQEESLKLRLVLIKELISTKVNPAEVKLIKKDIKKAEAKRLKNMFAAIDQISRIVAKDPGRDDFVDHMMVIDRPIR